MATNVLSIHKRFLTNLFGDRHYMQKMQRCKSALAKETADIKRAHVNIEFLSKTEKSALRNEINRRVDRKMKDQEKRLEIRRTKLYMLLAGEEQSFQTEALIHLQLQQDLKLKEMERRRDDLAKQRDDENRKIVEEKRIQQSMARCPELRPHLFRKNLLESKEVQLQQIKENQDRKKNAKELNMMWEDITIRDVHAKLISDQTNALETRNKQQKQKEDLHAQIKEKEVLKLDAQRTQLQNQLEMEKLDSAARLRERERLKEDRKKTDQYIAELTGQIRAKQKQLAESTIAQKEANEKLARALELEHQEEMVRAKETVASAKKEAAQYIRSLTGLLKQRLEEERKLEELLETHREAMARREQEATCEIQEARAKLHEDVLEGRRAQIEFQKQEALQRLRQKEAESEQSKLAAEEHERSEKENERRRADAARQYRCDLQKQIEYNNLRREEERKKSLRDLELERQEEEKLRKHAYDAIVSKSIQTTEHPFRKAFEPEVDGRYPKINPIF